MFYRDRPYRSGRMLRKGIFIALLFAGALLLFGTVVMFLWNAIVAPVTGVGTLTFWQALGLLLLSRILFGGWGRRWRGRHGPSEGRRSHWREKWKNMSEEERARYRQAWRERCKPRQERDE